MKQTRTFVLEVLKTEAQAWNLSRTRNLEAANRKIKELHSFALPGTEQCFGISIIRRLKPDSYYDRTFPISEPRYLFKISQYIHPNYNNLWVAYLSYPNPSREAKKSTIDEAFFVSQHEGQLKVIGAMSVALNNSNLKPIGWEKSIYNPSDLSINNLGELISIERYLEPKDDGFSLQEYLDDK